MTIPEIIKELDGLKDFVNDHGRQVIDGLIRELKGFEDKPAVEKPVVHAVEPLKRDKNTGVFVVEPKRVVVVDPQPLPKAKRPYNKKKK